VDNGFLLQHAHLIIPRLVQLCILHRFDGWFINIESDLCHGVNDVSNMVEFVQELTKQVHSAIDGGLVIWYASLANQN
jgi:endo-beta-N-acetylglucosaminidase D